LLRTELDSAFFHLRCPGVLLFLGSLIRGHGGCTPKELCPPVKVVARAESAHGHGTDAAPCGHTTRVLTGASNARLLAHARSQSQHLYMEIRPLTDTDAEAIATWRYPGRYATYDVGEIVTPERGFWAVEHEADLVGYCCFGHDARVPGVAEEEGILDVGYGMRPDLMGQGLGGEFVGAILDFAIRGFSPRRLRLLILDWNDRSRKVADALGFQNEGVLRSTQGVFLVMTREAREGHRGAKSRQHSGE
jgi:[ribosomal protein S18]-alanine N-acetyltransferase